MTLLSANNKIETTETNHRELNKQVLRLVGFYALSGWTDLVLEYTRLGFVVEATFSPTNEDDFTVILDLFNKDGSFVKQIIEE